jgi:hypothetical protein
MQVEIATGKTSVILQEEVASCNHVVPSPADPDLLLIDRDLPPGFAHGGDEAKTTRVWTLNRVTGSLVEIRPRDAKRFQVHSNWNYRGDRLYYHGKSAKGGMYIGVAARNGEILWESWIPEYLYGHLSPHPSEDVIYTDGLYSKDMVTAVHYQQRDALGAPKLEMIAKHSTEWDNDRYGQYCHPHCHISPDGRWLTYNKGEKDRSDVYVVRIA